MVQLINDIELPSCSDGISLQQRDDICVPITPLFCFNGLAADKKHLPKDDKDKGNLLSCLVELAKRSTSLGLEKALEGWRDYKKRADWGGRHGDGREYFSLRVKDNSAFRICNTRIQDTDFIGPREIFQVWEVVNEKN